LSRAADREIFNIGDFGEGREAVFTLERIDLCLCLCTVHRPMSINRFCSPGEDEEESMKREILRFQEGSRRRVLSLIDEDKKEEEEEEEEEEKEKASFVLVVFHVAGARTRLTRICCW